MAHNGDIESVFVFDKNASQINLSDELWQLPGNANYSNLCTDTVYCNYTVTTTKQLQPSNS